MNSIVRLIVCVVILLGWGSNAIQPVLAQAEPSDPIIHLTVKNEPLVDVLDAIEQQTGYQFNLTPQWEDHIVSANINNLPLEKGLKRLLRSLNHTILWEADNIVVIKVYGKATPGSSGGVSFAAPPQENREVEEPAMEPENEPPDEKDEFTESAPEDQPDHPDDADQEGRNMPDKPHHRGAPPE